MPLDPSIIGSFRPPEFMSPVNAMAQMYQLRALQGESEKNQLAMEKSRREMDRENTMRNLLARAGTDSTAAVNALRGGGFYTEAADLSKKSTEADKATYEAGQERFKYATEFMKNTRANLNKIRTVEDAKAWSASHHADPIMGPLLASQGVTQDKSFADIDDAWNKGTQNDWLLKAAEGTDQFATRLQMGAVENAYKSMVNEAAIANNGAVDVTGSPIKRAQDMADIALGLGYSDLAKQYRDEANNLSLAADRERTPDITNFMRARNDPAFAKFLKDRDRDRAMSVKVDASNKTENKYNEKLAGLIADKDAKMQETAVQAVDLAASADRVIDVLQSGKVITGTGAGFRLDVAKALNLIGADNTQTIKNTELLGSDLAKQTLASIKSSGLGTGQGFTDKDLKFLERATTGQVSWERETLTDLARLARLTAEKSAAAWNKRKRKLPKEARDLIDEEDIVIPPAPVGKTKSGAPAKPGGVDSSNPLLQR